MAEDRKFTYVDGQYVNRVSGIPIPDDEPIIIFRARDRHTVAVLEFYKSLVSDEHHIEGINDRIEEFSSYQSNNPDLVKEPGITRHLRLNSDPS